MIAEKDIVLALREVVTNNGFGTIIAVYNDISNTWFYYCGQFKPKNPSSNIYFNSIYGKCLNYILDNRDRYFTGSLSKAEAIATKINDTPEEMVEFDFRFVWFK
jgi:hypothetical protein